MDGASVRRGVRRHLDAGVTTVYAHDATTYHHDMYTGTRTTGSSARRRSRRDRDMKSKASRTGVDTVTASSPTSAKYGAQAFSSFASGDSEEEQLSEGENLASKTRQSIASCPATSTTSPASLTTGMSASSTLPSRSENALSAASSSSRPFGPRPWTEKAFLAWASDRAGFQPFPEDKDIKGGMVSLVDGEQHVLDFWASLSDREKACALMLSPETVRRCSRVAAYQIAGTDPRLCSWTMEIPDCVYEEWQGTVHRVMDATCADREKQGGNQTFSGPSAAQANSPSGSARETLAELSRKHALVLVFHADAPTMAVLLLLKLQIKAAFETRKACAKVLNLLLLLSWEAALPLPVSIAVLLSILFFQSRCHDDIPWLRSLSEAFDWLVRSVFTSDPLEPMYIEWKSDAFVSAAFLLISSQHVAEAHWLVLTTGLIILPYVFGALEALPRQSRHNSEFARARFAAIRINKALLLYFGWSSWAMLITAVFTFFPVLLSLLTQLFISLVFTGFDALRGHRTVVDGVRELHGFLFQICVEKFKGASSPSVATSKDNNEAFVNKGPLTEATCARDVEHDSLCSGDGVKDGESDSGSGSDGDDDSANDGDVDDTSNADSNGDGDGDGDINGNADAVGNGANDDNEIGRVNDDADGESIHAVERRSSRQVDMNVNIIE